MKTCPTGCGRKPRSGCYLCTECWYALPREQRREFNKAWRAYSGVACSQSPAVTDDARLAALANYRKVRESAVTVARQQLMQPEARA